MRKVILLGLLAGFIGACASQELAQFAGGLSSSSDPSAKALGSFIQAKRVVSVAEEIQMGNELAGGFIGLTPLVKNVELQSYVNDLGMWLALQSEMPDLPWRFGILDTDDYNAFSMPGGVILLSKGVIKRCKSESELAVILAHEIAHVLKRHHVKALQQEAQNMGFASLGEAAAANSSDKNTAAIATEVVKAGSQLYSRGLDKNDEYEADRMGMVLAARAGYNPFALVRILSDIKTMDPASDRFSLMFKTHPTPNDRLTQVRAALTGKLDAFAQNKVESSRFRAVLVTVK